MPYCNICELSINLHILDCVAAHHIKISGYSHLIKCVELKIGYKKFLKVLFTDGSHN